MQMVLGKCIGMLSQNFTSDNCGLCKPAHADLHDYLQPVVAFFLLNIWKGSFIHRNECRQNANIALAESNHAG